MCRKDTPKPSVIRIERCKRNARYGSWQREWDIDACVEETMSPKPISRENPRNNEAKYAVDCGRYNCASKRYTIGTERSFRCNKMQKIAHPDTLHRKDDATDRDEHDTREDQDRQSQANPDPRNHIMRSHRYIACFSP